mgnify:FL=1
MTRSDPMANLLFDIFYAKWERDGWSIVKHVEFDGKNLERLLGLVDIYNHEVHIYPHSKADDGPIEKTTLHEMIHVGADLDGEFDDNGMVNRLEKYLWKRINENRRDILRGLME